MRRDTTNRPLRHCARFARVARGGSALLAAALTLLTATSASAEPSLESARRQAQAILEQVATLDEELGAAAERYNGASYELGRLDTELRRTRIELRRARALRAASVARVEARLRQLYVNGESGSSIDVLLGARSLGDLLDRADLAQQVARQDAAIAREASALRARVARQKSRQSAARARQAAVVQQRAAERRAIEERLASRTRLLASVQEEVERLEEAERRRQAELRRRAELELARQRVAAAQAAAAAAAREASPAPASTEPAAPTPDAAPTPAIDATPQPVAEPSATAASPPDASRSAQVVAIAMRYLGVPYRWGAASPSQGFDCSGLTMYVFAQIGVTLPHFAAAQYQLGVAVSRDELQPGDLVFFRSLGHMGMYIGAGNFIHAPRTGDVVKISSLSDPYYVANWVGARRVL